MLSSRARDKSLSDELLVARARSGDQLVLAELIARHAPFIRERAAFYANPMYEAEDLAQEGMVGLLSAIRHYSHKSKTSFRTYAGVCISNRMVTALKSVSRQRDIPFSLFVPLNESSDRELPSIRQKTDPENILIEREKAHELVKKIHKILTKYEFYVFTAYLGGYAYSDIAKMISRTPKSVDNALQRARKKLSTLLR